MIIRRGNRHCVPLSCMCGITLREREIDISINAACSPAFRYPIKKFSWRGRPKMRPVICYRNISCRASVWGMAEYLLFDLINAALSAGERHYRYRARI